MSWGRESHVSQGMGDTLGIGGHNVPQRSTDGSVTFEKVEQLLNQENIDFDTMSYAHDMIILLNCLYKYIEIWFGEYFGYYLFYN